MGGEPAGSECGRCHGRTALVALLRTGYKRAEAETPARSSSHKPGMRRQGCREVRMGQEPGHAAEGRAVLNYHGQVGGAVAGLGAQDGQLSLRYPSDTWARASQRLAGGCTGGTSERGLAGNNKSGSHQPTDDI